jgi:hypothetical protein
MMVASCDEWDALPGVATLGRARVGRPPRDRDIKPAVILVAHPLSLTLDELKGLTGAIRLPPADNLKQVEDIHL